MPALSPEELIDAVRETNPDALASAIYAADDPQLLADLATALERASEHAAYYPNPEVIAEADALLIDVLRWPVADALRPGETLISAQRFAELRGLPIDEAQRILDHLTATDTDAATRLIASGVSPDFTREQSQVTRCIEALLDSGEVPTRSAVRAYALDIARQATRPWWDGSEPIITHPTLQPRIMSRSPITSVFTWLHRMDSTPAGPDFIDERIQYLTDARIAAGSAARAFTRARALCEHARAPGTSAVPHPLTRCVDVSPYSAMGRT